MKSSLYISLIALLIACSINACDNIEEPFIRDTGLGDTAGFDTVTFNTDVQTAKVVLLEEFTGHKCPNCPVASKLAHAIKEADPEHLIIVSVHAGVFSTPDGSGDFTYDFRTAIGTELNTFFKVGDFGYPNGLVNRVQPEPNKYVVSPQDWEDAVAARKAGFPAVSLKITTYLTGDSVFRTYGEAEFLEDMPSLYGVCVILTEDSIIKPQKNNDPQVGTTPVIDDYVHSDVLRGSFNGTWGSNLNEEPGVLDGQKFSWGFALSGGNDWNAEHCSSIAYIYDRNTLEVLQAIEAAVKQ